MRRGPDGNRAQSTGGGRVLRPNAWRPPDRHILVGVSHASGDPAHHRNFEIRASYDVVSGGWNARVGEQNLNEQRGDWDPPVTADGPPQIFPTAAACLGDAVARLIAMVDQEEDDIP